MATLAQQVARLGFRAVAFDVTGHGESPVRRATWGAFIRDVGTMAQFLTEQIYQDQAIYAYVGHSAGALSTMAARELSGIAAERFVCVSAPSHPFPMIAVVERKLRPTVQLLDRLKRAIAQEFATDWNTLAQGHAFANAGPDLLFVCDETDRIVPRQEGERLHALCPGSRLLVTSGYNHMAILASPELATAVGRFLLKQT